MAASVVWAMRSSGNGKSDGAANILFIPALYSRVSASALR